MPDAVHCMTPHNGADLLAELALRLAAGGLPGHAGAVLGVGQAGETALDRLRLMCLGARTQRDGHASPHDAGHGRHRHRHAPCARAMNGRCPTPSSPTKQSCAPPSAWRRVCCLEALAQGQLLAQQAARRPDGSVRLARARSSQNSVLPQSGDWAQLGSPLRFASVAALRNEHQAHPNASLQPRHAARRFVVFSPAEVDAPAYDANAQCVLAVLRDAQGEALLIQRTHERHTAHALDAIAAATNGRHGALRHVAGVLSWRHGLPCIEPWALGCEGVMIVPDFASASGALAALPLGCVPDEHDDPCLHRLEALRQHLATLLHHGLARLPRTWVGESAALARQLEAAGLHALARQLGGLSPTVASAQANPASEPIAPALMSLLALRQLHADAAALDGAAAVAAAAA